MCDINGVSTAIVSGIVTVRLPRWLEAVLNYPNYHLPQVRVCACLSMMVREVRVT